VPRWDVELRFVLRKEAPYTVESGVVTVEAEDYERAVEQARAVFLASSAPEMSVGEVMRIERVEDPALPPLRRIPCAVPGCQSMHADGNRMHLTADGRAWTDDVKTSGRTGWDHVLASDTPGAPEDTRTSAWDRILDDS